MILVFSPYMAYKIKRWVIKTIPNENGINVSSEDTCRWCKYKFLVILGYITITVTDIMSLVNSLQSLKLV